jgi:sugar porter (SP) family MFS transporter
MNRTTLFTFAISLLVGMGGILYGYDIGVVSGALLFMRKSIAMTDAQLGFIVGAVLAGGLVGTLLAGPAADRFGRRALIATACVIFISGVACILVSHSFDMVLAARLLLGVGVGIVAVAVPLYVAEIVPAEHRGKYVTFFQLFLTFGIVLAYFVDLAFTPTGNWRAMFAVVLIPALILFVGILCLPPSPRWLCAQGAVERAKAVLAKTHPEYQVMPALNGILASLETNDGTWRELFSSAQALPLFIAVSIAILNQWTGINTFLQYAPEIFRETGLGSNTVAMMGAVGIGSLNFLCTIVAIFLVDRLGRRRILLTGIAGVFLAEAFLVVSTLFAPANELGWLSLYGFFAFIIFFAIGPGVVVWLAISELMPTKLRGKAMALCLFFSSLSGAMLASVFPDLQNTLGLAGTYSLCAAFTFIYFILTWRLLPETKRKSLEEIQVYFQKRRADLVGSN